MIKFFNNKLINPILDFLKQGMSPHDLALAIVFGLAIGTFPMLGVTTLICTGIALAFKLNMVVIQLINYFVYPLQLIFFVPFIKLGGILVNTPPFPYSINEILEKLQTNLIFTIKELWVANMFGILAWAVIIIPISAFLFYILKHSFQRLSLTINNNI
jgi:uncharacterized protein (DUF2062 family)